MRAADGLRARRDTVMTGAPRRSLDGLAALTLFCWLWPLFHSVAIEVIDTLGYALKLGGGLLNLAACALSLIAALPLSILLLRGVRGGHAPVDSGRIVGLCFGFTVVASTVVLACLVSMGMFCQVGSCPTPN